MSVRSIFGVATERYSHYWLLAPAVLVMSAILVYPLLFSFWVSLFDWRMAAATHSFVGLSNYVEALTTSFFDVVLLVIGLRQLIRARKPARSSSTCVLT